MEISYHTQYELTDGQNRHKKKLNANTSNMANQDPSTQLSHHPSGKGNLLQKTKV